MVGRRPAGTRPRAVLAAAVLLLTACSAAPAPPPPPSSTAPTLPGLSLPRAVHRAVALPDGSVLLVGGCATRGCGGFELARTSDVVDPRTGRARAGAQMREARASGTATALADGRVLVVGGYPGEGRAPTGGVEVYDPQQGSFSATTPLRTPRADHTATLLADGTVLVAGGFGADGRALDSVEVISPATGTVVPGPALSAPRAAHAAVLVGEGVLLVGGTTGTDALASTEVLVGPDRRPGPVLGTPRVKHAAVALPDGRVLVVGGSTTTEGRRLLGSTELVSGATGPGPARVSAGPALAAAQYKLDGAVVVLPDGRVVVAGGPRLEVFDPADDTITVVDEAPAPRRSFVTATVVGPTEVLVAGGYDAGVVPSAALRVVEVPAR